MAEKKTVQAVETPPAMTGLEKLLHIQVNLDGNKDLDNSFGGYKYRNLDGILTKLKPFLKETNTVIHFDDGFEVVADRVYIKAECSLIDVDTKEVIKTSTAYAREPESKKGMDEAQLTGTCTSYARKDAISALLAISPRPDNDDIASMGEGGNELKHKMRGILQGRKIDVFDFCNVVFKKDFFDISINMVNEFLARPDSAIEVYEKMKNENKNQKPTNTL